MATLLILKTIKYRCPLYIAYCHTFSKSELEYMKCCKILGIPKDSDQETIRSAYLKLVKRYHPDSGTEEANADRFYEIDRAFKLLMKNKSKERWNVEDDVVNHQDINHTAPQHRQYLSYDGVGIGSPFQREKQYINIKAVKAADNVMQHRISKVATEEGALLDKAPLRHKIKTKYGYERLVEDLIQESMSKGEFNNLRGVGKPLPNHQTRNPYVDFVTHKLNEVLIDNGFTPEWITLQKEIREELQQLRICLLADRTQFGPCPFSSNDNLEWRSIIETHVEETEKINKKINKFNLVVPILDKQIMHVDLQKEAQRALLTGKNCDELGLVQKKRESNSNSTVNTANQSNVFDFFQNLFK